MPRFTVWSPGARPFLGRERRVAPVIRAMLPTGSEDRPARITLDPPGLAAWFLEPHAAAVSKYLRRISSSWTRSASGSVSLRGSMAAF